MHVVVVVAHPGEEAMRFGGTIATHVRRGHRATIVVLTKGGMGHASMPVEQLRETRVREVTKASEILGADLIVMQDFEDQWIPADPHVVARTLIDPLRALKPDVLLCHDPTVLPCDQSNTARGAIEAADKLYMPLLKTEYPPTSIPDIYHLCESYQRPDIFIDITDVMDVRIAAMRCHQTQIQAARDLYWEQSQLVRIPDANNVEEIVIQQEIKTELCLGKRAGAEYAEAYVAYRSQLHIAQPTLPSSGENLG